jgi:hypothetical protein
MILNFFLTETWLRIILSMHTVPIHDTSEKTLGCVTRGYSSNFRIILAQQFSESFSTVLAVFSSFLLQKYNPRESGLRILIFEQLFAIKKFTMYSEHILLIRKVSASNLTPYQRHRRQIVETLSDCWHLKVKKNLSICWLYYSKVLKNVNIFWLKIFLICHWCQRHRWFT